MHAIYSARGVVLTAKENDIVISVIGIICLDLVHKCKNAWRGRGIGVKLMEEIEEIGRKRECYSVKNNLG